jgi:hypothetical protein
MTDRPTNDRLTTMTPDADLDAALLDLAGALAPMTAPDLAAAVRSRVEGLGVPAPSLRRRLEGVLGRHGGLLPTPARPLRRGLVLALVALLVLASLAAAIGFGLPGLRFVFLGPGSTATPTAPTAAPPSSPGPGASLAPTIQPTVTPTTPPTPTVRPTPAPTSPPTSASIESLGLGEPVDLAELDARAGRHVLLPTLPELGAPLGGFVRGLPPRTVVSAAYGVSSGVPAPSGAPMAGAEPVAILIMELPGSSDPGSLQKMLPEGTTLEPVTVGGHEGFWISGEPHELLYLSPSGNVESEPVRLVGNVLAWNDGELTYRIEGAPDLATAMRIAASMR